MTARISLNLGRTGGHRPPLQSEHFLPLGKAGLPLLGFNANVPVLHLPALRLKADISRGWEVVLGNMR